MAASVFRRANSATTAMTQTAVATKNVEKTRARSVGLGSMVLGCANRASKVGALSELNAVATSPDAPSVSQTKFQSMSAIAGPSTSATAITIAHVRRRGKGDDWVLANSAALSMIAAAIAASIATARASVQLVTNRNGHTTTCISTKIEMPSIAACAKGALDGRAERRSSGHPMAMPTPISKKSI
ncbi:MAG: hypothetical protein RLY72_2492 [Planctomycetota bacterium]